MTANVFPELLVKEVIPMIDKSFRTLTDRDNRAMAGLSMGGFQTFQTTMTNLDKFAYIGGYVARMANLAPVATAVRQLNFQQVNSSPTT